MQCNIFLHVHYSQMLMKETAMFVVLKKQHKSFIRYIIISPSGKSNKRNEFKNFLTLTR